MLLMLAALLNLQSAEAVVVARDAIQPHLAIDADGALYAVFLRNGNIEFSMSGDKGATFGVPVTAIDAKGRARGGMQRGPRVAVDARKTIYVTAPLSFDDAEFQKRYPTQDLFLATSVDGGKTFSRPLMVNEVAKKAPESLHWLSAGGDAVFVAWLDMRGREKGQDLYIAKVTEQGKKISRNAPVASQICECCAPGLAVDGKGNPVLAYREGGVKASRPIDLAVSSNGGAAFKTVRVNVQDSKVDN